MSDQEDPKDIYKLRMKFLKMAANETAIRFLSPLYLVGSYASNPESAHDIDILMVVTKKRFFRLFGQEEWSDKRLSFRKKQKLYFEDYVSDMDIDFKTVILEDFIKNKEVKIKLDNIMEFPE